MRAYRRCAFQKNAISPNYSAARDFETVGFSALTLQQHSGVKLLPVVSAKKVLRAFYFMLTINVSLRSSRINNDKTVDARKHFFVSRCLLLSDEDS